MLVADALHCQKESAAKVVAEGGDYLFVVKENQPTLHDEIEMFFQNEESESHSRTEKNGGRIEKRTAYVSTDIDWLTGKKDWKNLTTIGAIHTEFIKGENRSSEWHYYISSRKLNPQELLKHARLEWAVESMHWLLDVHFSEDKTKVWDMNVQQNLNIMRKIASAIFLISPTLLTSSIFFSLLLMLHFYYEIRLTCGKKICKSCTFCLFCTQKKD